MDHLFSWHSFSCPNYPILWTHTNVILDFLYSENMSWLVFSFWIFLVIISPIVLGSIIASFILIFDLLDNCTHIFYSFRYSGSNLCFSLLFVPRKSSSLSISSFSTPSVVICCFLFVSFQNHIPYLPRIFLRLNFLACMF